MKVAFLIPTYNNALMLMNSLRFMKQLKPQPSKYVFLENNSVDSTLKILHSWQRSGYPTEIIRLWFRDDAKQVLGGRHEIIALLRQILLERARKLDVDYAVFVDDDVFIPYADFITRITSWHENLVGAPYPIFKKATGLCLSAFWHNVDAKVENHSCIIKTVCKGFNQVLSVASGAMCIGRELLMDRRVNFLPLELDSGEDVGYCYKARQCGYTVYLDCSLLLGHHVEFESYKLWNSSVDDEEREFKYGLEGLKMRERGVVLMPEKYLELLAEIDSLLPKHVNVP